MNEPLQPAPQADGTGGAPADSTEPLRSLAARIRAEAEWDRELAEALRPGRACEAPDAPPRLGAGDRLGGLQIVRLIKSGGMGEIYEAVQVRLKRQVALKVIRKGWDSPAAQAAFRAEQRVLARLHHTNVIPIHTAGRGPDGLLYFVMPYVRGVSLADVTRAVARGALGAGGRKGRDVGRLVRRLVAEREGAPPPRRPATGGPPRRLPAAYFRWVALALAEAAEGLHHAHQKGVIHRDVKPTNVMVDASGRTWVIDFGLAARLSSQRAEPAPAGASETRGGGTSGYMAPEAYRGEASPRSEVWGLGATLYEALTLRRAFPGATEEEVRRAVEKGELTPPARHVENVPRDLAAVCRKALEREPGQRYASAADFAAELRRWLGREPTRVRPGWWTLRPLRLWAWRNPWRALVVALLVALVGTGVAARSHAARLHAESVERQERERRRDLRRQEATQLRLTEHRVGWSQTTEGHLRDAAEVRPGPELRDEAAAGLSGLDARLRKQFTQFAAAGVAFDPAGRRLLIGGLQSKELKCDDPARVWDSATDEAIVSGQTGTGPVTYRGDVPLQFLLPTRERRSFLLWDAGRQRAAGEYPLPWGAGLSGDVALDAGASRAAAVVALPPLKAPLGWLADVVGWPFPLLAAALPADENEVILVWDLAGTAPPRVLAGGATALALSPDGRLLAAGQEDGRIQVWSVGEAKPFAALDGERSAVRALAFGRSLRVRGGRPRGGPGQGWLLAAGDSGGTAVVWDLATRSAQAVCRGSTYDIFAVAFNPDCTLLATGGRTEPRLWDVATGRLLLKLGGRDYMTDVAFSPDGRRLAVSSIPVFGGGGVDVWDLEDGRGIRGMRGLSGRVAGVWLSADGKRVAALAHNWQVGVWDAATGRLLRLIDVPQGLDVGNAGLAIDPTGARVAFAAMHEARVWEVDTGRELDRWPLPPGLEPRPAFHPSGKLLVARLETRDKKRLPASGAPPAEHPRRHRIYELPPGRPAKQLAESADCNLHVYGSVAAPDGRYFVVDGTGGEPRGARTRSVSAYDGLTGKRLWSIPRPVKSQDAGPRFDPTGKFLAFYAPPGGSAVSQLFEMPSEEPIASLPHPVGALGPGAGLVAQYAEGMLVRRRGEETPLVRLDRDGHCSSGYNFPFDGEGTHLAWGCDDGTVYLCDLQEVRRRLTAMGLGW